MTKRSTKQEIESIKRTLLNHIETDHVSRIKALERALESSASGWRAVRWATATTIVLALLIVGAYLSREQPALCAIVAILSLSSLCFSAGRFSDAMDDWWRA